MSYITRGQLRGFPRTLTESLRSVANSAMQKTAGAKATVFLSHSHYDVDLLHQARVFLGAQGVLIYVDWRDPSMPPVTTPATAELLKARITQCQKFVVLASSTALQSRWVSWELGFAAPVKTVTNIAILPVADENGTWEGSEYVGAYPRIAAATGDKWIVVPVGEDHGVCLGNWLAR